jgi:hypothetical protein
MRHVLSSYADFHAKLSALLEEIDRSGVARDRRDRIDVVVEAAIAGIEAEFDLESPDASIR